MAGTLQINLNIILELVILGEYGNERDYEVGNINRPTLNPREIISL